LLEAIEELLSVDGLTQSDEIVQWVSHASVEKLIEISRCCCSLTREILR
jgi:hypothetical protein